MILLALSCLQGRPKRAAVNELMALGVDGVQLTPGNPPDEGFDRFLASANFAWRAHHGYCKRALRRRVWSEDGTCLTDAASVHPPKVGSTNVHAWRRACESGAMRNALEVMYPGYLLGEGAGVEWAMDVGLTLVVDVSHVFIQRHQGRMQERTWKRLQDYPHVSEVHVSANDGRRDTHRPLSANSYGLAWARERACAAVPLVLECYMHRLGEAARFEQIAFLRGCHD